MSSTPQSRLVAQVLPVESNAVDMLFVIDDSRSMTDEQKQLGIWSNELFDVLSFKGELPDLHIGVVSSSVAIAGQKGCESGGDGNFRVGTATLQSGRYIKDVAGPLGRERNYTGSLTDTFAKMALVGDAGCGFEQPFKAARLALTGNTYGSEGFLRPDALLLVVFVTDEDDCSTTSSALYEDPYGDACSELGTNTSYRCFEHGVVCHDGKGSRALGDRHDCRPDESSQYIESVTGFADSLKRLKQHSGQVIVAGIYGKPNGVTVIPDERIYSYTTPRLASVCGTRGKEGEGATPAVRMNALMAQFGGRASQSSICEDELSWAMRDLGLVTRDVATRSPCLRGALIDSDVGERGIQPTCRVEISSAMGTAFETHEAVQPCERSYGSRCFTMDVDAYQCADTETQMAVHVEGVADSETLTVRCEVDDAATGRRPLVRPTINPE